MEETKKPAIRFDGFTENWIQFSIHESTNELNSFTTIKSEYPLLTSSRLGLMMQNEYRSYITTDNEDTLFSIVPRGACTYRHMSDDDVFHFNINDIVDYGLVSKEYPVFVAKDEFYLPFIVYFLNSNPAFRRFCRENKLGGTRTRLYYNKLSHFSVAFPLIDEQIQVGDCFALVDNLISLAQQKYDKLLTFKKSMLEKMFPQNGAKVPEVRFAGFDGEWVEYRFGDIVAKYSDPVATPTNGYTRLGIRSHGKGTFHSAVLPGMELETAQMHRVAANNFIVNITFGWEHAVAITDENDEGKLVSHRFPQYSFNEGAIPYFFKYLILDEKFRQHLELASPGGAGRNRVLKLDDMLEYQFMLPSVPEQESIADYLIRLDDLIQLKQSELEKLKNIKSALLEKMFV